MFSSLIEVGGLVIRVPRDMAARVGTVGPIAPHFGQVEHVAHDAECPVRISGLVGHLLHRCGHVGTLDVLHLHATKQRNDVAVAPVPHQRRRAPQTRFGPVRRTQLPGVVTRAYQRNAALDDPPWAPKRNEVNLAGKNDRRTCMGPDIASDNRRAICAAIRPKGLESAWCIRAFLNLRTEPENGDVFRPLGRGSRR